MRKSKANEKKSPEKVIQEKEMKEKVVRGKEMQGTNCELSEELERLTNEKIALMKLLEKMSK